MFKIFNKYMECSICLDTINNKSTKLICNHFFHKKCIKKWFTKIQRCPLCLDFQRKKYKVKHINSKSFFFINKTLFFHDKFLILGRHLIKYQHIVKMRSKKHMMCFDTLQNKQYFISTNSRYTTNEIYEQMKNKIESKLRRKLSQISIV